MGFLRQEYWSGFPFPSPVNHILSDLSTMTCPLWVTPQGIAWFHCVRQGCGPSVIRLTSFLWLWFQCVCSLMPSCNNLPSYLGFSYLGRGVSLHGCSSKVQPLLFSPGCSLAGMMLKLKLQYFGHLMRRFDSDVGKDWGQGEKGTTEDEMAGWHHRLDGREFEWTPGVGDGQGCLMCFDSWGHKESDTTEWLNWIELNFSSLAVFL